MSRPVTLFTGQWADLSIEDLCRKASKFGYQGLELACWGDHFEVDKALKDSSLDAVGSDGSWRGGRGGRHVHHGARGGRHPRWLLPEKLNFAY